MMGCTHTLTKETFVHCSIYQIQLSKAGIEYMHPSTCSYTQCIHDSSRLSPIWMGLITHSVLIAAKLY